MAIFRTMKKLAAQLERTQDATAEEMFDVLDRFNVVKINGAFQDIGLVEELRDAIEICDYFVTHFQAGNGHQNKDMAFKRFNSVSTTKNSQPFP